MKYSYPASLINLAAAIKQACSLYTNKYDNPVANTTTEDSAFLKLNIKNHEGANRVGIKFDNISAGKYFAFIHPNVLNKATGEPDDPFLAFL